MGYRVIHVISVIMLIYLLLSGAAAIAQEPAAPLKIAATVPELGSLAREIGGDQVAVTVFAKGTEDPHFVIAKPSYVKVASQADLFIQIGLEMEIGWAPVLVQQSRNRKILPGAEGFLDASSVIRPLGVPSGDVDRSMGDVHGLGNPHYLLDPINGLLVAQLIRDKLIVLRPAKKAYFEARYTDFRQRLGRALVGDALAEKYEFEKLARLFEHGRLISFLHSQNEADLLQGWFERMAPLAGTKAVGDHNMWVYFAERFQLEMVGYMEPKPGVPPTSRHLRELIKFMRADDVKLIMVGAYYDPRHATFLAKKTDAKIANLAHQGDARPGTDHYIGLIDYNINELLTTLGSG